MKKTHDLISLAQQLAPKYSVGSKVKHHISVKNLQVGQRFSADGGRSWWTVTHKVETHQPGLYNISAREKPGLADVTETYDGTDEVLVMREEPTLAS